jgi:hypothetical protein
MAVDDSNTVTPESPPGDPTQDSVHSGAANTDTPTIIPSTPPDSEDLTDESLSNSLEEPHGRFSASTMSASSLFSNLFINSGEARILRTPELPEGTQVSNYIFMTQKFTVF